MNYRDCFMKRASERKIVSGISAGVEWMMARSRKSLGLVFSPPLIGGTALWQIRLLRRLLGHRFDIFSYSYTGHCGSDGNFSLSASLSDSLAMLDLAVEFSRRENIALLAIASCYGAIPLLFAAHQRGEPIDGIVLVNAVTNWRISTLWRSYLRFREVESKWGLAPRDIYRSVYDYLNHLFPGIISTKQRSFGLLAYDRMKIGRMFHEFFRLSPLQAKSLPHTPVLCFYGRRDKVLLQMGSENWRDYEKQIRYLCPLVQFRPLNADHYLADAKLRQTLMADAAAFFVSALNGY
ncbi:MAG: alpha/beta fold hydrolase [Desulfobacteraceae bacterium]|nr:alpha/beta fold hydrolase [Desulfobacteraceae bacterium]